MSPLASTVSKGVGSLVFKVTIVVVAAIGGAGLVASNVFAALTATATNTSGGSVTTGTLKLQLAPSGVSGITGGFTAPIAAMGPGDTVNRYIDLSNTGTLDGASPTLQIVSSDSNTLVSSPTAGLQVTITACSVAWSNTGTCSGTSSVALASTPVSTIKASAQNITLPSVLVGGVNYLKVSTALPAGTENVLNGVLPVGTVQGLTASLTWTFVIQERAVTTTNS
jgi:Camelysin metallo-endopeptidase